MSAHRRQHPVTHAQQTALLLEAEACRTPQGQAEHGAIDVDHELQFVPTDHGAEVTQVVLTVLELVGGHRIKAVQAVGDAGASGLIERIKQVHAGAVVRQLFLLSTVALGIEVNQQARHMPRAHQRHQRVIQRHQQAQGIDQCTPETVLPHRRKDPRQPLMHRQLFQQRVHALPLLSNP
ncbi:hypothetical protein D3C80_1096880 [compost metagenome]